METVQASTEGLKIVDCARRKQKWNKTAEVWCKEAYVCRSTLNRFWAKKRIRFDNFVAICEAVGINWKEVIESKSSQNSSSIIDQQKSDREKLWRGSRCRWVWGRNDLIESIISRLNNPFEPAILALTGSAGYGKTEVASQVAKAVKKRNIFTNVLWVKARQTEFVDGIISQSENHEMLNWKQFIDEIAYQLNCPVKRVRDRLKSEKILIVLDNAETAKITDILANIIEMLDSSRVLITSRLRTNAPYVGLIPIQGLNERWSNQLLREEAKYKQISALLSADKSQIKKLHQLTCGAPLALHFVVGRVFSDLDLEPVIFALEQASGDVECFYQFSLQTAWERISDPAKNVLRYLSRVDASVTEDYLATGWGIAESDWQQARSELTRWYLLEENLQDAKGNYRYDLHPWVRVSIRGKLVDNWQPSLENLQSLAKNILN
ncbi:MAG: NB-ARC domain-containing protein, partial [Oscillatoria sp. PMC 1068.18]|nr:NB-ARC domain-containing protein [Oscillatoria sp. PMC 1068.18]